MKRAIVGLWMMTLGLPALSQHPSLAKEYFNRGQFDSAAVAFEMLLPELEKQYGKRDTSDYIPNLIMAATALEKTGQYNKAEKYLTEVTAVYEKNKNYTAVSYLNALNSLAGLYMYSLNESEKAEELWKKSAGITRRHYGPFSERFAIDLNSLGLLYLNRYNYEKAMSYFDSSLRIIQSLPGNQDFALANLLNNQGQCYYAGGFYEKAEPLYLKSLQYISNHSGEENPTYAVVAGSLAQLWQQTDRFDESEELFKKVIRISKATQGERSPDYAIQLNNLALLYKRTSEYHKADSLYSMAMELDKRFRGENHPYYARDLNNLGNLYRLTGKTDLAIQYLRQAMEISKNKYGENNQIYATHLHNLANLYADQGNDPEAESLMLAANRIFIANLRHDHPALITRYNDLARLWNRNGNLAKADSLYRKAFDIYQHEITTNTGFLSESELNSFLTGYLSSLNEYQSFNVSAQNNGIRAGDFAYNIELSRKAILLRSAMEVRERIMESHDSTLIDRFFDLLALRRKINKQNSNTLSRWKEDPKKLEKMANDIEKELSLSSKIFSETTRNSQINWTDVRNQLQPDEAAVEFSFCRYRTTENSADSIACYAIVLRKQDSIPALVFLGDESQIISKLPDPSKQKEINAAYRYSGPADSLPTLFQLTWKPLLGLLADVKTICFAPAGVLHRVALSALPFHDSTLMTDRYNMIRLTSTRALTRMNPEVDITGAVVYGGVQYEPDTVLLARQADKFGVSENYPAEPSRSVAMGSQRGFRYLPGTKTEAEEVASTLKNKGIPTILYTGSEAVEESFINLSGLNSPSVIHLSTHGFYFPGGDEVSRGISANPPQNHSEINLRHAGDPLQRSGLLLAGANLTLKGLPIPNRLEDGILTAREVSNLNLRNTRLVVLSACHTGLGDINESEGVEGLQRGFAMAGVTCLILSLWEVPDKETSRFMSLFYRTWMDGHTIRASFKMAQKEMKLLFPHEPAKWAGFILVE